MPIFDFKCQDCGKVSELLATSSADGKKLFCSSCGSQNLERLISTASLVKSVANAGGHTCCGREERCSTPPCSTGERCHRY